MTKRIAEIEAELSMPPCPKALAYLWNAYLRLRRRKASTDMGSPKPLEGPDLESLERRSGLRLAPWEFEILEAIDDIYLSPSSVPKVEAPDGQTVKIAASSRDAAGVKAVLGSVGVRRVVKRNKGG